MKLRDDSRGFSLVELISVMVVSALFAAIILDFGINYWRYTSMLESDLDTFVSRLDAQDYIREYVGTSSGLIQQNSIPDNNAGNPDPIDGPTYWLKQHAVPGTITTGSPGVKTPILYFRRPAITTTNALAMNGAQPYEDEYILYLDGTTQQLRARTLANPSVANNKAKTTCPPEIASVSCPADKVLLDSVSSIGITYYSRSGNTIDYQSITDPNTGAYMGPDLPVAEAVQFTFNIAKKTLFQTTNTTINQTIVRIALRNT